LEDWQEYLINAYNGRRTKRNLSSSDKRRGVWAYRRKKIHALYLTNERIKTISDWEEDCDYS